MYKILTQGFSVQNFKLPQAMITLGDCRDTPRISEAITSVSASSNTDITAIVGNAKDVVLEALKFFQDLVTASNLQSEQMAAYFGEMQGSPDSPHNFPSGV